MKPDGPRSALDRKATHASLCPIALTALRLVPIVGICLILAACGYSSRDRNGAGDSPSAAARGSPSAVDDRTKIEQAWKDQDRMVHQRLDGYGWINRAAGVAHIPIDRAMELIVAGQRESGPPSAQIESDNAQDTDTPLQRAGRRLFQKYGCNICHGQDAPIHAPSLVGIYGQRVRLSDGSFVRADDQYLRTSIQHASRQVVAGYVPVMPAYHDVIPEPDVVELIAYLKSFTDATSAPTAAHSP
jgi:mono/diheme cytochrome c family protein